MLVPFLKLIFEDYFLYSRNVSLRIALRKRGLSVSRFARIRMPALSRLTCQGSCSVGDFSIVDIVDDPNNPNAKGTLVLGSCVYIGELCNIRASGSAIAIGNDSMIASQATIISMNHELALDAPIRMQKWSEEKSGVTIGSDVWIGSQAVILPGARIGNGAVVAAGAVVRGIVKDYSIVAGVPAREIADRVSRQASKESL